MTTIRPHALPTVTSADPLDKLIIDRSGSTARSITIDDALTSRDPFATTPEATAGAVTDRKMSPATTAAAINFQLPNTATGRAVLNAATASDARIAIGAGDVRADGSTPMTGDLLFASGFAPTMTTDGVGNQAPRASQITAVAELVSGTNPDTMTTAGRFSVLNPVGLDAGTWMIEVTLNPSDADSVYQRATLVDGGDAVTIEHRRRTFANAWQAWSALGGTSSVGDGITVVDRATSPPIGPSPASRYAIIAAASGLFAGKEGQIATWSGSTWSYVTPAPGTRVWAMLDATFYRTVVGNFTADADTEAEFKPVPFGIWVQALKLRNYLTRDQASGTANAAPAIELALRDASLNLYGTRIVDGASEFLRIDNTPNSNTGFVMNRCWYDGQNKQSSIFMLNFHGGSVFRATGAGGVNGGGVKNLSFGSYLGITGGILFDIRGDASSQPDGFEIENVANGSMAPGSQLFRFLNMDGSARVSPSGIREALLKNMTIFGCYGGSMFIQSTPVLYGEKIKAYSGTGQVHHGSGVPSNAFGANGDYYNDFTNRMVYGPKAGGVWPAGQAVPAHVPAMPTTVASRSYDADVYLQGTAAVKSGDVTLNGSDIEGNLFIYHMNGLSYRGSKNVVWTDSSFIGSGSIVDGPRSGAVNGTPGAGVTIA